MHGLTFPCANIRMKKLAMGLFGFDRKAQNDKLEFEETNLQ